jgi:tetratricopeptide (TPR) repeat protein
MTSHHAATLLFNSDVVRSALERMRQAEPSGDNPLRNLVWVRKQIETQGPQVSARAAEFALNHALTDTIQQSINHLRRIEGLSQLGDDTRETAIETLRRDFSHGNAELEAWSILYYRFVRVDLNFQMQDIARALDANPRLINRRLVHGCYRLTQELSRLEAEARAGSHRLWLKLKLPPATYATLFGMENRLPHLLKLIETNLTRTTALIGPGGIGKTTLGHAAARFLIEAGRLGDVVWLELASLTSHEALLAQLAQGLGYLHLVSANQTELEACLGERLESTQTLIVIDNADLLVNPHYTLPRVDALVGDGRILLTLREQPPDIPVQIMPVHPLPPDVLAGLLQETARLRRVPGANLLDKTRLKAIIDAVGGNPLAAKLVVSHLAFLPLERVLEELPVLQTPSGDPLFDTIYMPTWEHLSEHEKLVFLALSLAPLEGIDWQSLNNIVDLPPKTLDAALLTLIQSSLVEVAESEPCYVMHALTRRFAQERGANPPWNEVYRNLLRHILVHQTASENGAYAVTLIRYQILLGEPAQAICEVLPQIALAVRRSGQWADWREVLRSVIEDVAPAQGNRALRAYALTELGVAAGRLGSTSEAIEAFEEAVALWGEVGNFAKQAETLLEKGQLHEMLGHTGPAYEAYQRAAATSARFDDRDLRCHALNGLAGLAMHNDRPEQALELLQLALESFDKDGPDGQTLSQLGAVYLQMGRVQEALTAHEQALAALDQMGDLPRLARAHLRMGIACHAAEQPDQSFQHLQSGLDLMRLLGDAFGQARLLTSLGTLYAERDRQHEALRTWKDALALQERLDDQVGMATTLYNIADLQWRLQHTEEAYSYLKKAAALAEHLNITKLLPEIENHPLLTGKHPPSLPENTGTEGER